jgi:hypothetical protein
MLAHRLRIEWRQLAAPVNRFQLSHVAGLHTAAASDRSAAPAPTRHLNRSRHESLRARESLASQLPFRVIPLVPWRHRHQPDA